MKFFVKFQETQILQIYMGDHNVSPLRCLKYKKKNQKIFTNKSKYFSWHIVEFNFTARNNCYFHTNAEVIQQCPMTT